MVTRRRDKKAEQREIVTVTDGLGVISVRGGPAGAVLSITGEPVAADTADFGGSIGRLVTRHTPWPRDGDPHLVSEWVPVAEWGRMRDWLADPSPVERLSGPLAPLLALLEPGEYRLRTTELEWPNVIEVEPGEKCGWPDLPDEWDRDVIVPTHRWPPPAPATALEYGRRIVEGRRPLTVAIRHSQFPGWFLLDGHHKLAAYLKRRMNPPCIAVERFPPHGVRRDELPHWWPSFREIWES
jgi:hypothetical protein